MTNTCARNFPLLARTHAPTLLKALRLDRITYPSYHLLLSRLPSLEHIWWTRVKLVSMVKVLSCICQPAILPPTSKHTHIQRSGKVWVRPCLFNILLKFDSGSLRRVYEALGKKENARSLRLANLLPDQKITHTHTHLHMTVGLFAWWQHRPVCQWNHVL